MPAFDADQCRVVGRRLASTPAGGTPNVLFSISCPASVEPTVSDEAPLP